MTDMIRTGIYSPYVTAVTAIPPYTVEVTFDDGTRRRIDLKDRLWGPVFEPLLDPDYFAKVRVGLTTIEWPNGADIAPETLYEIGELIEPIPSSEKAHS
jgi:hypothetical protein